MKKDIAILNKLYNEGVAEQTISLKEIKQDPKRFKLHIKNIHGDMWSDDPHISYYVIDKTNMRRYDVFTHPQDQKLLLSVFQAQAPDNIDKE